MIEQPLPSLRKLLLSTVIAIAVAGIVLVAVILPAEYGLDPLRTGRMLGLDALSAGSQRIASSAGFNSGVYEVRLKPGEEQEHKALMEKGATVTYNWEVRGARHGAVIFDFHGEPTAGDFPDGYFKSYGEGEGSVSKGTFVAPFTGRHGWYWQNVSGDAITVVIKLAGKYASFDRIQMEAAPKKE